VRLRSGQLVIVFILSVALAAAVFAWSYQYQQGRCALAYWGGDGAQLIRAAPRVELLVLGRKGGEQDAPGHRHNHERAFDRAIIEKAEISDARGLVHARQALLSDASYKSEERSAGEPEWHYALRFHAERQELLIAFDLNGGYVQSSKAAMPLRVGETLAEGLRRFFQEQLELRRTKDAKD
jgi:hypothetical protein